MAKFGTTIVEQCIKTSKLSFPLMCYIELNEGIKLYIETLTTFRFLL